MSAKVINLFTRETMHNGLTVNEINELMPTIVNITKKHNMAVQKLINALESIAGETPQKVLLETEINAHIKTWQTKIEKLGGKTKGLWIADFDSGDGYFCWKYPEQKIMHWHKYNDGFSGRISIEEYTYGEMNNKNER